MVSVKQHEKISPKIFRRISKSLRRQHIWFLVLYPCNLVKKKERKRIVCVFQNIGSDILTLSAFIKFPKFGNIFLYRFFFTINRIHVHLVETETTTLRKLDAWFGPYTTRIVLSGFYLFFFLFFELISIWIVWIPNFFPLLFQLRYQNI